MIRNILLFIFICLLSFAGRSSHALGGDITWTCQGGQYVFQLVFYRDCNGAVINTAFETIDVWGHPSVTSINLNFVSSSDVSPLCSEVPGGPQALVCGVGQGGGNGDGAIEKAIYRSDPIDLPGVPPSGGWVFTYQNFSRSSTVTNLVDPSSAGISLVAKIFENPESSGGCVDNSPQFLQEPYFVSCVGDSYEYNMNPVDPDLDSLHISFGQPLNHFPGEVYSSSIPAPVPFETGFSYTSPTPGISMNPSNVPAQIHPNSGNLTFTSYNSGNYILKIVAKSFRKGILIAEVEREMQLFVVNCNGANNAPVIAPPLSGSFETTVNAGDLVNFNLSSTDIEVLQDGSPQDNMLLATGLMFGTNFTSNTGCAVAPCATLDATPLITMSQGVNTTFNWQTKCDHLVNPYGFVAEMIPYHFVFKVQDNYCPVPKVSYATVTINVLNPGVVPAPEINCIQSDINGDVTISWDPVADPLGTFSEYQIYSLQDGLIGSIGDINTTFYTDNGVNTQKDYFIASASGCNGNTLKYSDTLSNIYLDLNNPTNGTASLQWNDPADTPLASMGTNYHIYREYPAGTWTLIDSVPYGTHFYSDTITICSAYLNYQIVLPNSPCDFSSNIEGDNFEDQLSPSIPVLNTVTIDTLTNEVTITWNENDQPDTYGYIIYVQDESGSIVELDMNFGKDDTTYTYSPDISIGPLTYSVAAFDSCLTNNVPPSYQTSAKGELHTSVFLQSELNICSRQANIIWTDYIGWDNFDQFELYGKNTSSGWTSYGTTNATNMTIDVIDGETYTFVVKASSTDGRSSFSNTSTLFISTPIPPAYNYLQVATVVDNEVLLKHHIESTSSVQAVSFQKMVDNSFEELVLLPASGSLSYVDEEVNVNEESYVYRVQYIDSCGIPAGISNEARTILLNVHFDEVQKRAYLFWNKYVEFDGAIIGYNVYRSIDGETFGANPITTVSSDQLSFEDDLTPVQSIGKICYYVEAIESINQYGLAEISRSNEQCVTLEPIIYVPNAFMPDGINMVFKPVISDFDPSDYDMTIFDRWGQVIFKTNLFDEGWDGKIAFSGKMAPTGTYIYMISLRDGEGIQVIRRGHVSLLK